MNLWKIAWRSIQQRGLSSFLTGLSMALGVTLMVAILAGGNTVENSYESGPQLNHHIVVGPKGSATQLVLYTIFHADQPLRTTLHWSYYQEFLPASKRPDNKPGVYATYVNQAIPIAKGDNFKEAHVIGTTSDFFVMPAGEKPLFEFAEGEVFSDHKFLTGVVGATAARELKLKVGSKFNPTHSAPEEGGKPHQHDHDAFTVVGVLKPTGTPNDRALFINIEGHLIQEGHARDRKAAGKPGGNADAKVSAPDADNAKNGNAKNGNANNDGKYQPPHDDDGRTPLPDRLRQVSAILIRPSGKGALKDIKAEGLARQVNDGNDAMAVSTLQVAQKHYQNAVKPMLYILAAMTGVILISSAVSILVSIYNSMNERRRDLAILRALGASRTKVMLLMLIESVILALLGGLVGWVLGHLLVGIGGAYLTPQTGISFTVWDFSWLELILIPGLVLLAGFVGYLPALAAYKTDVAKCLSQFN